MSSFSRDLTVQQREAWRQGLDHLRTGRYWDAHESFEALWRPMPASAPREVLQALIQVAAAAHKIVQTRRGAAAGSMQRGMKKLLTHATTHLEKARAQAPGASGFEEEAIQEALTRLATVQRAWSGEEQPLEEVAEAIARIIHELADALSEDSP